MSIPYVIDGETDLDSTTINRWIENINTVPLASITGALEGYGAIAKPSGADEETLLPVWDRGTIEWIVAHTIDLSKPGNYQCDLTGVSDSSATLQGAMDDIRTQGVGAILHTPYGRVRFSETLTWKYGVLLEGGWGSGDGAGAPASRWPYLLWAGDDADNAIETETLTPPNNWTWGGFRRMTLLCASGFNFQSGIVFTSRVDSLLCQDFQIAGALEYGIDFQGGGINVALSDFRTDAIGKASIRWVLSGGDSLTLSRFTSDNRASVASTSGSLLYVDGLASTANSYLRLSVNGEVKVETNEDLPVATPAQFWFETNPALSNRPQIFADFTGVWEAAAGGVTRHDLIGFSPETDFVSLTLSNCKGVVSGVPLYAQSALGTSQFHPLTVIMPLTGQINAAPASSVAAMEFVGNINVMGQSSRFGKREAPIIQAAESDLAGVTVYTGTMLEDPATVVNGHRAIKEVRTAGTLGTLSGVTATSTAASATITASDVTDLRLGQYLSLAGDFTGKYITSINPLTNAVTVNSGVGVVGVTDGALSWTAPTYRTGQIVPVASSKTWDPGSIADGAYESTTVSTFSSGGVTGDFAAAAFSVVLPAGMFLSAEVTASNTVTVTLWNFSGSSQDVGSGTLRVQVRSQ